MTTRQIAQSPGGRGSALGWQRYSWAAGLVFVVALLAEAVVSPTIPINQDDSAATFARELAVHRHVAVVVARVSMVYAVAFLLYLCQLHDTFRTREAAGSKLSTLVVTTFAVDSVGDVLGSVFVQGFGLGGVIACFGLILDLIGFVPLLAFVTASSLVLMLRRA